MGTALKKNVNKAKYNTNGLGMQRISSYSKTIIVIFRYRSFLKLLSIISVNPRTTKSTTRTCNHPAEEVPLLLHAMLLDRTTPGEERARDHTKNWTSGPS